MNYQLLSAIFRQPWAIDGQSAVGYAPLINNILNGYETELEGSDEKPYYINASSGRAVRYFDMDDAPRGSIAVIPLTGPLMKNDQYCGPRGMATWGKRIREADDHQNIDGILLNIDSPGGTVDGTEALAKIVSDTQKPIVAFIDGLMASAALWIGVHADQVIASTDTDRVGSVGVLLSFADAQPFYERQGVKFHQIVSNHSKDKTQWLDRLLKGDYDEYRSEALDPLAEKFQQAVRESRPGVTDDHLTGKIYFARDVVGVFIDSIGSFDYALERTAELGKSNKKNHTMSNKEEKNTDFTAIMGVIGVESLENDGEGTYMNREQLQAIEDKLIASGKLQEKLDELNGKLSSLEEGETIEGLREQAKASSGLEEGETVASLKKDIADRDLRIEELENQASETETQVETKGDDDPAASDAQADEYHEISKVLKNKN
jgi:signal peptide peptidase SppA